VEACDRTPSCLRSINTGATGRRTAPPPGTVEPSASSKIETASAGAPLPRRMSDGSYWTGGGRTAQHMPCASRPCPRTRAASAGRAPSSPPQRCSATWQYARRAGGRHVRAASGEHRLMPHHCCRCLQTLRSTETRRCIRRWVFILLLLLLRDAGANAFCCCTGTACHC